MQMIAGMICLIGSVLVAALALPMYVGKIPPNTLYGYRTARSMSDAESWYAANKIAGRDLLVGSLTSAVVLLLLLTTDSSIGPAALWLPPAVFASAVLGAVVHSVWQIERGHLTHGGPPIV
jgi:hypothetical protein